VNLSLTVQRAVDDRTVPDDAFIESTIGAVLAERMRDPVELCVRVVGGEEIRALNARYRGRDKATNVLSFTYAEPAEAGVLLGDLAICAAVVAAEAAEQGKSLEAHWAHMLVHGTLHLLGHDHIGDHEAAEMEDIECEILARLGFSDPYRPRDRAAFSSDT